MVGVDNYIIIAQNFGQNIIQKSVSQVSVKFLEAMGKLSHVGYHLATSCGDNSMPRLLHGQSQCHSAAHKMLQPSRTLNSPLYAD
jgi:hypothetical protein